MEPQFITIPIGEYQQLITALQDLSSIRDEIKQLREKVTDLEARQANTESWQMDHAGDNAALGKRVVALEMLTEPQPKQQDRGQVLKALLAANDGKMLESEARRLMGLSRAQFSQLLSVTDGIETKPFYKDKRKNLLKLV